jgi:hypothetical protein
MPFVVEIDKAAQVRAMRAFRVRVTPTALFDFRPTEMQS